MWQANGLFVRDPTPFSEADWGRTTNKYAKSIAGLSPTAWEEIFAGSRLFMQSRRAAPNLAENADSDSDSDDPRAQLLSDPVETTAEA